MIFNPNEIDNIRSRERLEWLISNEKRFEIKELRAKRSNPQNAYLHLILSFFALEVGETMEFIKQHVFKAVVNKDTFEYERVNQKSGKKRTALKSTSELDTKEMTDAIDRFKNWTVKKTGIRLPEANENEFLDYIQNEIDKNKQWL